MEKLPSVNGRETEETITIPNRDKKKTEKSVEALMGKKPELRFKFIQENSKKASAETVL